MIYGKNKITKNGDKRFQKDSSDMQNHKDSFSLALLAPVNHAQ